MADNITMTCDDIKKKLKRFLEDLLVDEEYQAFLKHLEDCPRCKTYVTSVDSFSNQVWKLAEVKVPSDLSSTILFKLTQPEEKDQKPKLSMSKKVAIGALVVILASSAFFFGNKYLKNRNRSQEVDDSPIVTMQQVRKEKSPEDREAERLLRELEGIATRLGVPEDKEPVKKDSEELTAVEEESIDSRDFLNKTEPHKDSTSTATKVNEGSKTATGSSNKTEDALIVPKPLHWHFVYTQEKGKTETDAQQNFSENLREQAERESDLLDVLNPLGIILDYQNNDLFTFIATGEKVERILEKILLSSGSTFSFRDYTSGVITIMDEEHDVSIYLEKKGSSALHWHISLTSSRQKSQLLDIIREKGGMIDEEFEDGFIFFMQRPEIKKLKTRIMAMRVSLLEFGDTGDEESQLSSGLVEISVCFTKR
ncbi:MAG: zf-HC2 domain-containing protein [Candidatus Omnitrophica bacterium]|nr:zf-HC2 domain-containing protein [Candidatus Omnitrophota bacterium]